MGVEVGAARIAAITTAVTDAIYEKLLVVTETDAEGNTVERERKTTINNAMKSCRRAWNIAGRGATPVSFRRSTRSRRWD